MFPMPFPASLGVLPGFGDPWVFDAGLVAHVGLIFGNRVLFKGAVIMFHRSQGIPATAAASGIGDRGLPVNMCIFAGIMPFLRLCLQGFDFLGPNPGIDIAATLIGDQLVAQIDFIVNAADIVASDIQIFENVVVGPRIPQKMVIALGLDDVAKEVVFRVEGFSEPKGAVLEEIQDIGIEIRNDVHSNYFLSV